VLINDALSTKQTATTAKVQEEKGSSSKTSASKARGLPIKEQFAQAAAGNWTTAQWMEASLTGTNISQWRLLVRWPFDEEGAVFRFNKAGDGLFGVSSDNRCVCVCVCAWGLLGCKACCTLRQRQLHSSRVSGPGVPHLGHPVGAALVAPAVPLQQQTGTRLSFSSSAQPRVPK
jgi:hypothetical protein